MGKGFTIKLNQAAIRKLTQGQIRALEKTAEALHTEVVQAQVVPRDTGALQNTKFYVDYAESYRGYVALIHQGPYARRLYFHPEYNFHQSPWTDKKGSHEGNANAKGEWFEDWLPGGEKEDFAENAFAKFLRQEARDVIE